MTNQFNQEKGSRGIEWCDQTVNATGGCFHRCRWTMPNGKIAMCYAEATAERGVASAAYQFGFEHHYFRANGLKDLGSGYIPRLRFIDSMSDLFGHWVPPEQVNAVLTAMTLAPMHTFQSLTKAPKRLLQYADRFPPNLWVGVSSPPDFFMADPGDEPDPAFAATNMRPSKRLSPKQKETFLRVTLETLAEVKRRCGCIVWMSIEPLSWDVAPLFAERQPLDWVVIGAATDGPKKYQPEAEHLRGLLEIFDETDTPVFYKGNISPLFASHDFGDRRLQKWREDFPVVPHFDQAVIQRQKDCETYGWMPNTFLLEGKMARPDSWWKDRLMAMDAKADEFLKQAAAEFTQ